MLIFLFNRVKLLTTIINEKFMKTVIFSVDRNRIMHILEKLEKENFEEPVLLSTSILEGKEFSFKNINIKVKNINSYKNYNRNNIAVFMVGRELSEKYIYDFIENDMVVLDGSDYYLDDKNIPTVLYNVNRNEIKKFKNKNIVKLPSASTIQLIESIKPLENIGEIKRLVVSTYQAVSSVGKSAMDELFLHTKKIYENSFLLPENFKKQIAFNVLPQVGDVGENNYYGEEQRILVECSYLLKGKAKITSTCAIVPVFTANCQAINVELKNSFNLENIFESYENNPDYIDIVDRFEEFNYATPKEVATEENISISRIRRDFSIENGLNLWSVADNIKLETKNIVEILKFLGDLI